MSIRSILVPLCPGVPTDMQLEAARLVAGRVEGHVEAVFLRPDPEAVFAALPGAALSCGVTAEKIAREGEEQAAASRTGFETWRTRHGLPAEPGETALRSTFARWSERTGLLEAEVVRKGRLSDLIVLNLPGEDDTAPTRAFDAAAFDTARPVLLVPRRLPDDLLRHVLVAWNGSLEATRAVTAALPLLRQADRVSIFTAPTLADEATEPGPFLSAAELAESLVWHGVSAHTLRLHPNERPAGAALLHAAAEHGATMLVMGAFTRSRVRSLLLGGVTRHVVRCAALPVLMAH